MEKAVADTDDIQVATGTYPAGITIEPVSPATTRILKIAGAGANATIVDGANSDRGFQVREGVTLDLSKLTIQNCTGGSGSENEGGAVKNLGTMKLSECSVLNNQGSHGGGIFNGKKDTSPTGGVMDIVGCSISGNKVPVRGGGISNGGGEPDSPDDFKGTMTLTNSTVSGNFSGNNNTSSDKGGGGGGIYNHTGSTLSIINTTVTGNTSNPTASGPNGGGGINNASGGTLNIKDSVVANNTDTSTLTAPDCFGTLSSGGSNVIGNSNACGFAASTGDQVGTASNPINPFAATPPSGNAGSGGCSIGAQAATGFTGLGSILMAISSVSLLAGFRRKNRK